MERKEEISAKAKFPGSFVEILPNKLAKPHADQLHANN